MLFKVLVPILLLALHLGGPFLLGKKALESNDLANGLADVGLLGGAAGMHVHRKRKAFAAGKGNAL